MTDIFPSIIPDRNQTESLTVHDEWDYNVLRKVVAEHDDVPVSGRSTQLEMADWITGQYSQSDLETLREAGQADNASDADENNHIKEALTNIQQ